jgi:hypothetical protein
MRVSLRMLALFMMLLVAPTTAQAFTTTVDTVAQTVRVDFTGLPAYEQIRLEGVTGLFWCACIDLDNPSSMSSTGFTVNGSNLEMQYEGAPPPSTNFITYHYLDGYVFTGFEQVDWVVITQLDGEEMTLVGDRPLFVPEPSTTSLSLTALVVVGLLVRMRGRERGLFVGLEPSVGEVDV